MVFVVATILIVGFSTPAFAAVPNPATGGGFGSTPATTTSFSVSWSAPVGGDAPTGYTIEGALEDNNNFGSFGAFTTLVADTGDVTEYNITGLSSGSFYELRVIAFNNDGASTPSDTFDNGTMWEQQNFNEEQEFNENQNFAEGTQFAEGQEFDAVMDFSGGGMDFGDNTDFQELQNFDEAGTFSGNLALNVRTTPTTEWADIFGDLKVAQSGGIQGYESNLTTERDYDPVTDQVIYGDFSAVTAGVDWSDLTFTDTDDDGKIDCASAGACELSDLPTAVTYADGTILTFDLIDLMEFGAGSTFVDGQTFGKGQTFDEALDFSGGSFTFAENTAFQEVQNFQEAGAFSQAFVLPLRTTPTTEWADVFNDLGIIQVTGYDQATGTIVQNYETGIIFQDFSAVTAGSFWHDITFTDANSNAKIDCASAATCELADMAQGVTYAAGTTTTFDYVLEQEFGEGTTFVAGQQFGAGQSYDEAMDFSAGGMTFGAGNEFNTIQNFQEAGTFSKASEIGTLPERTTPTTEWADVFDDLGITVVDGYDHDGTVAQDYNSNIVIYADFSATTAGNSWNDAVFTDLNGNGSIDCASAGFCELSDMSTATTYAAGTNVWFDQIEEMNFGAGTEFYPGQTFGAGQSFDVPMDFSTGGMVFGNNVEFGALQNFEDAGTFSGDLPTLPLRTSSTTEWADVFDDLGITSVTGYDSTGDATKDYTHNTVIYADFDAVTAGSFWNDSTFTDGNSNGIIDCASAGACELSDLLSPVTYAAGSVVSFDNPVEQDFGAGVEFYPGQTFGKGQVFDEAMDFSAGAMTFPTGVDFDAIQNFHEAGAFSNDYTTLSERTVDNATTEWADIFDDLGIDSVTGYEADGQTVNDYDDGGIIYGDFIAVTSGSDWSDNLFTDANGDGIIDCSSAATCELADRTTAVSYAKGTNVWFDYVEPMDFGAGVEFYPGQQFGPGQMFNEAMDFSTGGMTFDTATEFGAVQNFNEAGAFSGQKTLDERTVPTSDWFTILSDVNGGAITVINGFTADMAAVSLYETNKIIYADFTAVTAGSVWNDILFTDANGNGIIECTGTAANACELADLTTPVTYAAGTKLTFDYVEQMTFGAGSEFYPGQEFGKGQVFDMAMDFSTGAMIFPNDVDFDAIQNFHEAGTFSGNLTIVSERTTGNATTEWADVFDDLGIDSVSGYEADYTTARDYETGEIVFGDFIAVTSGNDWSDNLFTDGNGDGIIDCASPGACELADLTTAVSYAAGTNVWFDYVAPMDFGAGVEFYPGQQFGPGQLFDEAMDFSTGAMVFDTATDFDAVQNFDEAGTFASDTLPERTTPTTEWFDVFTDLGITSVTGFKADGITASDYVTGEIIYADFSAVTAGNDWNDSLFTDANSNGDIDCVSAAACELADMAVATTYANGTVVTFDYIEEMTFGAGTEFYGGQDFGKGQSFTDTVDFSAGAMTFANDMEFPPGQSFVGQDHDFNHDGMEFGAGAIFAEGETFGDELEFTGAVTFDGTNTFGDDVTFGASQDFDIFETSAAIGMGAVGPTKEVYTILAAADGGAETAIAALNSGTFTTGQKVFFDFDAAPTAGDQINALQFTDNVVVNGIIDCTGTGTCELADLAENTTLAGTETLTITQDYVQVFSGTNIFGDGTEFAGLQTFSDVQDFSTGEMTFAPGMEFATSQSFEGQDHDFVHDEIVFGASAVFEEDETFGDEADFSAGAVTFDGENTFGEDTTFGASQDFGAIDTDSGALGLAAVTSTEVEFIDIFGAFDTADTSIETSDAELYESGILQVEFSAVTGGTAVNDVMFTDANGNGIIDCTSDAACELADLSTGVTFNSEATVTFSQDLSQTFTGSNTFGAGTVISDNQDFSAIGTQDFTAGSMTFGAGVEFAAAEDLSGYTHTFDTGTEFNGDTNFKTGQVFADDTVFNTGQTFDNAEVMDFTAEGITFGTDTSIDFGDNDFTFGTGATFADGQDFTDGNDHVFTATDLTFGAGTDLPVGETFGEDVNFTGNIDFPDDQNFPEGAEFSGTQVFDADHDPVFDDFSTFGDGIEFAEALDFKDAGVFEGDATFVGDNTFGAGTTFTDGVTFTESQTFSGAIDFGVADMSGSLQTITAGSQFAEGTTFASDQPLPANTVLDSGLLLSGVTCPDATCTVSDEDVLSSGEIIEAGVTVAAISSTVTNDTPTMSIDGLGISLAFEEITDDGTIDVQIMDPTNVAGVIGEVSETGSLTINAEGDEMETISSVIDFDFGGTASASGEMTIVLPYSEGELGDIDEGDLEVLHYSNGEWITEDDCTIDTINNEITCTVDSID